MSGSDRDRLAGAVAALRDGGHAAPDPGSRLGRFATAFGLAEVDLVPLLLAIGPDVGPADALRPTVADALALGGEAVWGALCPQAPLRRWRIVDLDGGGPLPARLLRIDERILFHLLGIDYLDARLDGLVEIPAPAPAPTTGEAAIAKRLAGRWHADAAGEWPVLQLVGAEPDRGRAIAAALIGAAGQRPFRIASGDLPRGAADRLALARLCDRELALSGGALIVEQADSAEDDRAAAGLIDRMRGPTIVFGRSPLPLGRPHLLRAEIGTATAGERRMLWADALGPRADTLGVGLDSLAGQFALDRAGIAAAVETAGGADDAGRPARLWDAARTGARRALDDLADRIESEANWADLVLPDDRLAGLRDIAVHVRRAQQVLGQWGWAARGPRGLGITALFAGPSGTGKTLAAEVLANDLRLDLYRIDLASVVSKYIGETEKNLRRIFEAAEASGAILLFDEADALFGKRSEVKDSHDRYANIEVSYLLQRMEAYRGLAVLTTNMKNTLDPAFLRRLRFVIDFPFPDAALRGAIWRDVFPADTPVGALDHARLARLGVAGGAIRTIALNAAFLAAEEGGAVEGRHVLAAARREYAKLDKPATAAEFGGAR